MSDKPSVFICYAHADKTWHDLIVQHLSPLLNADHLDVWSDKRIEASQLWKQEIVDAITRADAAVLVVSPAFYISQFIASEELPRLLGEHKNNIAIYPLLARPSVFASDSRLNIHQSVNSPGRELSAVKSHTRDRILSEFAQALMTRYATRQIGESNTVVFATQSIFSTSASPQSPSHEIAEPEDDITAIRAFSDQEIFLPEFLASRAKHMAKPYAFTGYSFDRCVIRGPAVFILEHCYLNGLTFDPPLGPDGQPDPRAMLYQCASSTKLSGVFKFEHSIFRNCTFVDLGMTGPNQFLQNMTARFAEILGAQ